MSNNENNIELSGNINDVNPEFGCLGITDDCMLRCKMCHKWEQDIFINQTDLNQAPTVEQYRQFLQQLKELVSKDFVVNFGGGEALLYKDIYEIIKIADDLGMRTNLNSNGWLINEEVAKKIAASGLKSIKLSLDSLNPKIHDYMRGVEGVYSQVMIAIDNLDKFAPDLEISLNSVIYEQTYRDFVPLVEWVNCNEKIYDVLIMVAMQPNNTDPENNWWEGEHGFLWPKDKDAVGEFRNNFLLHQII